MTTRRCTILSSERTRVCCDQRLKRFQQRLHHCAEGKLDAVLLVLGIDGSFNIGAQKALNYFVFGLTGSDLTSTLNGCSVDDILDDVILVIKRDAVHLLCSPASFERLIPLVGGWYNIQIHCLQDDPEDTDALDDFKVASFVRVFKGTTTVGIPLEGGDPFEIVEKWPIIQAYAHEGSGGGGFFSLVHNTSDASDLLEEAYTETDTLALIHVFDTWLPQYQKQWDTLASELRHTHLDDVCVKQIDDQLQSYWNYGSSGVVKDETLSPKCVSVGNHAITCEVADPRGPLQCARTLLTASVDKTSCGGVLIQLYNLIIELVYEYIAEYTDATSPNFLNMGAVTTNVATKFKRSAQSIYSDTDWNSFTGFECLQISKGINSGTKPPQSQHAHFATSEIKYVCIRLRHLPLPLPNTSSTTETALAYGDCFIHSTSTTSPSPSQQHCVTTVITSSISRSLVTSPHAKQHTLFFSGDQTHHCTQFLGDLLSANRTDMCVLHYGQPIAVEARLHVGGGMMYSKMFGALVLLLSSEHTDDTTGGDDDGDDVIPCAVIRDLQLISNNDGNFLLINCTPSSKSSLLWGPLSVDSLVFRLKKGFHGLFLRDIWPLWKPQHHLDVNVETEVLEPVLHHVDPHLKYFGTNTYMSDVIEASMFSPVKSGPTIETLDVALFEPQQNIDTCVSLTILTGVPGSGKARVSASLVALAKESIKWIVLRPELDWGIDFNQTRLHDVVEGAVKTALATNVTNDGQSTRVLLITAGYTDIATVVDAITHHPKAIVCDNVCIESISCCIDPNNLFWMSSRCFPHLLDQCAEGWCSNIVLTGETCRAALRKKIDRLLRCVNSSAAMIKAEDGRVTGIEGFEAILEQGVFNSPRMRQLRHLHHLPPPPPPPPLTHHQENNGDQTSHGDKGSHGVQEGDKRSQGSQRDIGDQGDMVFGSVFLQFVGVLDWRRLTRKAKAMLSDTTSNVFRIKGKVVLHGENGTDVDVYRFQYVLRSHHFSLQKMKSVENVKDVQSSILFIGTNLDEHVLKDWLRDCLTPPPKPQPLRTTANLSAEERKEIAEHARHQPLPSGYFHNGRQYCCMDGTKTSDHPDLAEFVRVWLEQANVNIEAANLLIEAAPVRDLFDVSRVSPTKPTRPASKSGRRRPNAMSPPETTDKKDADSSTKPSKPAAPPPDKSGRNIRGRRVLQSGASQS